MPILFTQKACQAAVLIRLKTSSELPGSSLSISIDLQVFEKGKLTPSLGRRTVTAIRGKERGKEGSK